MESPTKHGRRAAGSKVVYKTIPDPMVDGPSVCHSPDFKANRMAAPASVVADLKSNASDYISHVEFELKMAINLRKSIDDVASVVEHGAELNREVPGSFVVDMQILNFNTKNMLKTKQKYMNTYKIENHDLQTTARRMRQQIADKLTEPQILPDTLGAHSRHTLGKRVTTPTSLSATFDSATRLAMYASAGGGAHTPAGTAAGGAGAAAEAAEVQKMAEEIVYLRRRVRELEGLVSTPPPHLHRPDRDHSLA